jgi:hypothetical protein
MSKRIRFDTSLPFTTGGGTKKRAVRLTIGDPPRELHFQHEVDRSISDHINPLTFALEKIAHLVSTEDAFDLRREIEALMAGLTPEELRYRREQELMVSEGRAPKVVFTPPLQFWNHDDPVVKEAMEMAFKLWRHLKKHRLLRNDPVQVYGLRVE